VPGRCRSSAGKPQKPCQWFAAVASSKPYAGPALPCRLGKDTCKSSMFICQYIAGDQRLAIRKLLCFDYNRYSVPYNMATTNTTIDRVHLVTSMHVVNTRSKIIDGRVTSVRAYKTITDDHIRENTTSRPPASLPFGSKAISL